MKRNRTDPRTPAERDAIARGQKAAWDRRKREQAKTDALMETNIRALNDATRLLAEAGRRLLNLNRENRKLRRQLQVKTQREEIHEQLRQVDAEWRVEAASAGVNPLAMSKIHARRTTLEGKLARLDGRRRTK